MGSRSNRILAGLVLVPGVIFGVSTLMLDELNARNAAAAAAGVGISGVVAAGVIAKPSQRAIRAAVVWSLFSVVFEIVQAQKHYAGHANGRALLNAVLGLVRFAGAVFAARLARTS